MDIHRAMEIIQSSVMTNVSYRGIPVYIKEINANNQTAIVFPMDEMDHEQMVELSGLLDEGPNV